MRSNVVVGMGSTPPISFGRRSPSVRCLGEIAQSARLGFSLHAIQAAVYDTVSVVWNAVKIQL